MGKVRKINPVLYWLKRNVPHFHWWGYIWQGEIRRCYWCGRTQYKYFCKERTYLAALENQSLAPRHRKREDRYTIRSYKKVIWQWKQPEEYYSQWRYLGPKISLNKTFRDGRDTIR